MHNSLPHIIELLPQKVDFYSFFEPCIAGILKDKGSSLLGGASKIFLISVFLLDFHNKYMQLENTSAFTI